MGAIAAATCGADTATAAVVAGTSLLLGAAAWGSGAETASLGELPAAVAVETVGSCLSAALFSEGSVPVAAEADVSKWQTAHSGAGQRTAV